MFKSLSLFNLFSVFSNINSVITTNKCENDLSSTWHWDSNSQPRGHESPHLTTRPGSRMTFVIFVFLVKVINKK